MHCMRPLCILSDKILVDKTAENLTRCRKFCPLNNIFRYGTWHRKFSLTYHICTVGIHTDVCDGQVSAASANSVPTSVHL